MPVIRYDFKQTYEEDLDNLLIFSILRQKISHVTHFWHNKNFPKESKIVAFKKALLFMSSGAVSKHTSRIEFGAKLRNGNFPEKQKIMTLSNF